jgi:hypothetical protein
VILSNRETNFSVDLEPCILVHKDDIWRLERILKWEKNLSVIKAFVEISVLRALDSKVPGIDVIFERCSFEIGKRLFK